MPKLRLYKGEENLDEFHIPASDTKGHSARHWFRCIPAMARVVEQIVQSGKFPYRTKGDLLRHALHRHTKWLQQMEPVQTVSGQVGAILEVMRDEEMNNDFNLIFNKMDERIGNHRAVGDYNEAIRLIMVIKSHIGDMPDGFWKSKYQRHIESKYGDLIKMANKASFNSIGEGDDD